MSFSVSYSSNIVCITPPLFDAILSEKSGRGSVSRFYFRGIKASAEERGMVWFRLQTSRKNSLELIELSSINKVSLRTEICVFVYIIRHNKCCSRIFPRIGIACFTHVLSQSWFWVVKISNSPLMFFQTCRKLAFRLTQIYFLAITAWYRVYSMCFLISRNAILGFRKNMSQCLKGFQGDLDTTIIKNSSDWFGNSLNVRDYCKTFHQWRSQPDNLVPLCKFQFMVIIHFFRNWLFSQSVNCKYLHSRSKSSGWLRYCLSQRNHPLESCNQSRLDALNNHRESS